MGSVLTRLTDVVGQPYQKIAVIRTTCSARSSTDSLKALRGSETVVAGALNGRRTGIPKRDRSRCLGTGERDDCDTASSAAEQEGILSDSRQTTSIHAARKLKEPRRIPNISLIPMKQEYIGVRDAKIGLTVLESGDDR